MTRLRGFCENPEQTGDRMASRQVFFENIEVAPTDEIKIFCFIAYGSLFFNRNNHYHLSGGYTATSLLANLALSEAKHALLKESL